MNLVGIQPLVRHLLIRGGCSVLVQLIHRFRLQFLRTSLQLGMKTANILRHFDHYTASSSHNSVPKYPILDTENLNRSKGSASEYRLFMIESMLSREEIRETAKLDRGASQATRLCGKLAEHLLRAIVKARLISLGQRICLIQKMRREEGHKKSNRPPIGMQLPPVMHLPVHRGTQQ